jgi:hypothetical protein
VKPESQAGQAMILDAITLEAYNEGLLTKGCTEEGKD